jgi:hypothetical protein
MQSLDLLPLIAEAAARVYSVVSETPLIPILRAMRWGRAQGWWVEGASGVALAAYFKEAERLGGRKVVVLICGGNPSPAIAAQVDGVASSAIR